MSKFGKIMQLLSRVAGDVEEATKRRQIPERLFRGRDPELCFSTTACRLAR